MFTKQIAYIEFTDGARLSVPIDIVAQNRAMYYKRIDNIGYPEALQDTMYDFEADEYEVTDWLLNNMELEHLESHGEWENKQQNSYEKHFGEAKVTLA